LAEKKSFLLRLPPELMDELNRWAADDLRSLNGQIEYVLREAVRKQRRELPEKEPDKGEQTDGI
jgi:hypothetical protein